MRKKPHVVRFGPVADRYNLRRNGYGYFRGGLPSYLDAYRRIEKLRYGDALFLLLA